MNITPFIESCKAKSPCEMEIRYNEPMSEHCTFKVGGPADCWIRPSGEGFPAFAATLVAAGSSRTSLPFAITLSPVFVLYSARRALAASRHG